MHRVLLTALLLTSLTLAGCAEDAPPAEEDDGFSQELEATDDTGVIRGIVIDPSIVPVSGVKVTLQDGQETTTNEAGEFGFADLEPGSYFLEVSKLGYRGAQTSVNVEAGVDKPPIVKVRIERDASTQPYVQQYTFEGFLQCSASATAPGVIAAGGNACSLLDVTGAPLDEPLIEYELDRAPSWIQTEMVWDSTQPAGDALDLKHSWECDTNDGFLCDHSMAGPSPLLLASNETVIGDAGYDEEQNLIVRVFSAELSESQGTAGVTFDQRFTHYTSVFYGFQPEAGWSFVADGPHPLPE